MTWSCSARNGNNNVKGENQSMKKQITALLIGSMLLSGMSVYAQTYTDADTIKAVQTALNEAGFDCGEADGIIGSRTRAALQSYQLAHGLETSEEINDEVLVSMGLAEAETEAAGSHSDISETDTDTPTVPAGETDGADGSDETAGTEETDETEGAYENVIYDSYYASVTATLSEDRQEILFHVQNDADTPILIAPAEIIANDISLEMINSRDYVSTYMLSDALGYASDQESFQMYTGFTYIAPHASGDLTYSSPEELQDFFGYDKIEQLSAAIASVGLSHELVFDGNDVLNDEDILFAEYSATIDCLIEDSDWDGTWEEPEGIVIYDADGITLTRSEKPTVLGGAVYFDMVLENHSDHSTELNTSYELQPLINNEIVDYVWISGTALPGTRAHATASFSGAEDLVEDAEDLFTAYMSVYLYDFDSISQMNTFDFAYGEDAETLKARSVEAAEEQEAAGKAELLANAGCTIEETTLFDQDGISLTATAIGTDPERSSLYLYLTAVNPTDSNLEFNLYDITINGYYVRQDWLYVNAGETLEQPIYISTDALSAAGIDNIGEIRLSVSVMDSDSWDALADPAEDISIKTSVYEEMDTTMNEDLQVIYEDDTAVISAKYIPAEEDVYYAGSLLLTAGTKSDAQAALSALNLQINGVVYYGDPETILVSFDLAKEGTDLFFTELYYLSTEEGSITSVDTITLDVRNELTEEVTEGIQVPMA